MNNESDSDREIDERIEILKYKYLQKTNQVSSTSHTFGLTPEDAGRRKFMRGYDAHSTESEADSDEGLEETNMYTETDVTLPLACSSGSCVRTRGVDGAVHVCEEMKNISEKLQEERVSLQVWAAELCERERELQRRENTLQQNQHNIHRLRGEEEELQQQHQREASELREALKQKNKDLRRIKNSFESLKEINDSLKKRLHDVSEQNRKLESQCGKVQSRLENLQRRLELPKAHSGRENVFLQTCDPKASKQEPPPSAKASKGGGAAVKLTGVLLDWVVNEQLLELRDPPNISSRLPSLHHRCSTVLPLLVEFLHQMSVMESSLQLSVLRCIHCCLSQLQHSTQHAPLTSTLRRLGEEVFRGDSGNPRRRSPLLKSPCLHTRVLSSLIIIRSVSQVDISAQALRVLCCVVKMEEGQRLFLHYGALSAVLGLLRGGSAGLLLPAVEILLQMSTHTPFLEECGDEEFFRCVSLVLRGSRVDPAVLENVCVILQKLSSARRNKRLFEAFSLHLLLQEKHRTTDPTQTFLSTNLSSILLNLNMLTR